MAQTKAVNRLLATMPPRFLLGMSRTLGARVPRRARLGVLRSVDDRLRRTYGPTVLQTVVGPLSVPEQSDTQGRLLRMFGVWEPVITAAVDQLLPADFGFVDVGAHLGYYSVLAAKSAEPNTRKVLAVEPLGAVREHLQRNLEASSASFEILPDAIGDTDGYGTMRSDQPDNLGGTFLVAGRDGQHEPVRVRTLTSLLAELPTERNWLKVDIEGGEGSILRALGSGDVHDAFPLVSVELNVAALADEGGVESMLAALRRVGYEIYVTPNEYSLGFLDRVVHSAVFELPRLDTWPARTRRADLLLVHGGKAPQLRVANRFQQAARK